MVRVVNSACMQQFISHSSSETFDLGLRLSQKVLSNSVLLFYGDLGAGKTTFIKGVLVGALNIDEIEVTSPTYTYLNIYTGKSAVYHFDLYRLRDADEFLSMGFDEMFDAGGICCVEWAERITSLKIPQATSIQMRSIGSEKRLIEITPWNEFNA
jgi:tRNA threonylcarbamoyladenosine biosynthesis protein TsaE